MLSDELLPTSYSEEPISTPWIDFFNSITVFDTFIFIAGVIYVVVAIADMVDSFDQVEDVLFFEFLKIKTFKVYHLFILLLCLPMWIIQAILYSIYWILKTVLTLKLFDIKSKR
jgi:hypothetical protein